MPRFTSTRISSIRMWAGLAVVPTLALAASACGGSGPSRAGTPTSSSTTDGTQSPGGSPTGSGATVTMNINGYLYQVSLRSPGVTTATTFTTDDGTGAGGRAIDAPPGQTLLVATLNFANKTDRQEPLPFVGASALPDTDLFGVVSVEVPQSDASALGVTEMGGYTVGCGADVVAGDCSLGAAVAAFTPAQTDITTPPELAPGSSGTVTILPVGSSSVNYSVPQSVVLSHVKIYVQSTVGCLAATPPSPGCLVALN
jgi:hypothetical protein